MRTELSGKVLFPFLYWGMYEYINHNFFLLMYFIMNGFHPPIFIAYWEGCIDFNVFRTIYSVLYIYTTFMHNAHIMYNECCLTVK